MSYPGAAMSRQVSFFIPTLDVGGAEKVNVKLANELSDRGYEIDVLVSQLGGDLIDELGDGVTVRTVGSRFTTPWPELYAGPRLRRYIDREKPDVLVSSLALANVVAAITTGLSRHRPKLIQTVHAPPNRQNGTKYRISHEVGRYTYCSADLVVAVSNGVRDELCREVGVPRERTRVIYNPVVDDELRRSRREAVDHTWFDDDVPVVLNVGSLRMSKGQSTLIHAFDRLSRRREARLMLIGDGNNRENLLRQVDDLGIDSSVEFLGERDNPYKYMTAASVLASASRYEGLGNVIIEALACGCPVVSTDCPYGPAEILEGGEHGKLVPVGDAKSLAAALESTLDEAIDPSSLQNRAADFHVTEIVDQYEELLY